MDPTSMTLPEGRFPWGLQKALNLSVKTSSSSHNSQFYPYDDGAIAVTCRGEDGREGLVRQKYNYWLIFP